MVITETKTTQAERVEKVGDKIKKKSSAESHRGWITGQLQRCRNQLKQDPNNETLKILEIFISEELDNFNACFPDKIVKVIIIEGWKNTDGEFPIHKDINNDWVVEVWNGDSKQEKKVPKENINRMLRVIRQLKLNKEYTCYQIAELMGYSWHNDVWKERMKIYFPIYYLPLKILNELKIVKYGHGSNKTIRLK